MVGFLRDAGLSDDPIRFLEGPFVPKPQFGPQSRFSDGTFPVYYSALDFETTRAEMRHHSALRVLLGSPEKNRLVFYREVRCLFDGRAKDLRPQLGRLPCLIAEQAVGGYDECNIIAGEARASGLDGLLTPSARHQEGTCLPVFERDSLSDPALGNWMVFRVGGSGEITDAIANG